jgi:hypothetical protein
MSLKSQIANLRRELGGQSGLGPDDIMAVLRLGLTSNPQEAAPLSEADTRSVVKALRLVLGRRLWSDEEAEVAAGNLRVLNEAGGVAPIVDAGGLGELMFRVLRHQMQGAQ